MKKHLQTLAICVSALVAPDGSATLVSTSISGKVYSINGTQLPTNLRVDDLVSFRYEYDDAGTEAHNYYLDGRIETVPLALYPNLLALSDANVTLSANLLEAIGEFQGTSGYQELNSNWVWTESSGARIFNSWLSPSTNIYMGYMPAEGLSNFVEGRLLFWVTGQQSVTTMFVDWTEVTTSNSRTIPEPATLGLLGAALAGFSFVRRRNSH